jgi:hypothetical protein
VGTSLCVLGELGPEAVLVSGTPADPATSTRRPLLGPVQCLALTTCVSEQLLVHDAAGTQVLDSTPAGAPGTIASVSLSGSPLTVNWTDAGQPRSQQLR